MGQAVTLLGRFLQTTDKDVGGMDNSPVVGPDEVTDMEEVRQEMTDEELDKAAKGEQLAGDKKEYDLIDRVDDLF